MTERLSLSYDFIYYLTDLGFVHYFKNVYFISYVFFLRKGLVKSISHHTSASSLENLIPYVTF